MFKPIRMTRVLVGGHKNNLEAVIDAMHQEGVVHLEDYRDPDGLTSLGSPLPAGEAASGQLVRVRGLLKSLDLEGLAAREMTTDDAGGILKQAEESILPIVEEASRLRNDFSSIRSERAAVEPFAPLDVELSAVTGLESVRVYLGTARQDPGLALRSAGVEHSISLAPHDAGMAVVVVVRTADVAKADPVLAECGFNAAQIPDGADGTPSQFLARLSTYEADLASALYEVEARLAELGEQWGPRLAALESHLANVVDRTQAPLQFGVTESTFHLEGWVPAKRVNKLQNTLAHRFGDRLYLDVLGDAPMERGHGDGHGDHDDHHEADPADEAPIHMAHKGPARNFQFLLTLLARPRYKEIDPTVLMAFFFPLFFGFMVGDFLVGIVIALFAMTLRKRPIFGMGGDGVAKPLIYGGVLAAAFGLIVFGEALGIHFVVGDKELEEGELSWEALIYGKDEVLAGTAGFAHDGFIHKTAPHSAPAGGGHGAAEDDHGGGGLGDTFSLKPHGETHLSVNGWFNLGYYSKVHDIGGLLMMSVLVGLVHLILGFLIGIRNVYVSHGLKLAVQEKVAWLTLMGGFAVLIWALAVDGAPNWSMPAGAGIIVASIALLWMGAAHVLGAGFVAILEVFGLVGNILSYTRLAAIGASKAGMAIAFSSIGLTLSGGATNAVWWVVYVLGFIVIILLAMLSGGLQSLRLQYVEFFQKFYVGGGRPYLPFGRRAARS